MTGNILLAAFLTGIVAGVGYALSDILLDYLGAKFQTGLLWVCIIAIVIMVGAIALNPWFTWYTV